jgi:hypothetical protein
MDDTISRAAAIDIVKKNTFRLTFAEEQNCEGRVAWSADAVYSDVIEGALLELPSAKPEIIRCKDCKYQDEEYRNTSTKWLPCMDVQTDNNWYCGSAEREVNSDG